MKRPSRFALLQFLNGFFLCCATGFGYVCGSPLPRCLLGVMLMLSSYCMTQCSQWQRTVCLLFVRVVGPYSELAATYDAYQNIGPAAPDYSVLWLDNFVFSLVMEVALASIASQLAVPLPAHVLGVLCYLPAGLGWAFLLTPTWAHGSMLGGVLIALAEISSLSIFVGLDLTSREFAEKERAHERYIAALSHDFGTPISALQMATTQLREHVLGAPSLAGSQFFAESDAGLRAAPLLFDGMDAALEVMAALKRKAIDVGKLNLGEALNPERAPCCLRELMAKVEAIARYMPHNERVLPEYFVSDDLAAVVSTDASWCFMILLNLVRRSPASNASPPPRPPSPAILPCPGLPLPRPRLHLPHAPPRLHLPLATPSPAFAPCSASPAWNDRRRPIWSRS